MKTATINGQTTTYIYDGEGRRVKTVTPTDATVFVYDAMGRVAAEYSSSAGASGTQYLTTDAIGSTRLTTNAAGQVSRHYDYLPFGEELGLGNGGGARDGNFAGIGSRQKFTGKERDAETGFDFFGARYYSAAQGRWTIPDWSAKPQAVPYADLKDPQSLNLYGYVRNNPLKNRDLDGHWCLFGYGTTCNSSSGTTGTTIEGAAVGTGAQLLNDGIRRGQYQEAASQLSGPASSAGRKVLQAETYNKLSPIGKAVTDAARSQRVGQLAGKTAEQLAESASRTSGTWNAVGSASKVAGGVGVVVGVGIAAYNVSSAPEAQRPEVAAGQAGALGGGLLGGIGGAKLGAIVGTFIEPGGGTAVGAIVGALLGGGGGSVVGEKVGTEIYKKVEDK